MLKICAGIVFIAACLFVRSEAREAAPDDRVFVGYVDASSPSAPTQQVWDGVEWADPESGSVLPSNMTWQSLASCPIRCEVASVSVLSNKHVSMSLWNGTRWTDPATLTTNAGKSGAQVAAAAYESNSGELLIVYRRAKEKNVYYRTYTTSSPSEQVFAMALNGAPVRILLIPKPGSNEVMMLVKTGSRLYAAIWNGAAFTGQTTLDTNAKGNVNNIAGAYTTASGHAMVIWAGKSGDPKYRVWDGSAWLAQSTISGANKAVGKVSLAVNPSAASNEALVAWIDNQKDIRASRWNGSTWSAATVVETNVVSHTQHRLALAYQPDGAKAVLAWHRSGDNTLRCRVWSGGAWSAEGNGPNMGSETTSIKAVSGPRDNEVTMTARRKTGTPRVTDYVLYTKSGTVNEGETDVNGPIGEGVAGVTDPAQPSGTAGTTDLTYASGTTASISPGSYRNLTAGSNCTLNLSPGTYIFRSVTLASGTAVRANTATGDVSIIVTTSGWSASNAVILEPLDADDPGLLKVHINGGDCSIGDDAIVTCTLLYTYNGKFTCGANADLTGLIYAKNNITITEGVVEPSEALTPSGYFLAIPWLNGSAGAVSTICTNVHGNDGTDGLCRIGSSGRVRVVRWREVGQDEP